MLRCELEHIHGRPRKNGDFPFGPVIGPRGKSQREPHREREEEETKQPHEAAVKQDQG